MVATDETGPRAAPPRTDPGGRRRFRGDIDGLRAIAILLVVGFHAGVPGFPGGFIGVDVFFVISGFLITGNLATEASRTGGVALLDFWAKRIRRLVPALALLVAVVVALSLLALTVLEARQVARDGTAAALYVSNLAYANQATDYFADDIGSSVFLHTWSLAVEEQFYLVWPVLVGAVCLVGSRRGGVTRRSLATVLALVGGASFALSWVLTTDGSPHAFFGLPSRAWEFAAGGLLALLVADAPRSAAASAAASGAPAGPEPADPRHRQRAAAAVVAGLATIAVGTLTLTGSSPYPGWRALVPVVGTLLVIGGGAGRGDTNVASTTLAARPAQWLGRVSYSWYLWHWPLMLLAVDVFDRDHLVVRVAAVAAALGVATAAYRFVENPVRFSPRLVRSRPRTYVMGAVVTAAVVAATLLAAGWADRSIEGDADLARLAAAKASVNNWPCDEATSPGGIAYCQGGDVTSGTTVVLMGDSFAGHWSTAFDRAAAEEGIRLAVRWRSRCPDVPAATYTKDRQRIDEGCTRFRDETFALVDELDAAAIVGSHTVPPPASIVAEDGARSAEKIAIWAQAYEELLTSQAGERTIGAIVSTPGLVEDPVDCLFDGGTVESCTPASGPELAVQAPVFDAEAEVLARVGVPTLDLRDQICGPEVCPLVVDGVYVFADNGHLTPEYTLMQVPEIRRFLRELTRPAG